jgi:predicted dehydrogenase
MTQTRWAILGPGDIGGWFARALPRSAHGVLHAVGSTNPERAAAFAAEYGAETTGSYAEILARDDVDAVYIATVNTAHTELALAALDAGKAVLCEKPAAPTVAELERILSRAKAAGLPFAEAYKHRFGPFARAVDAAVADPQLVGPLHLVASFGFAADQRSGRLFDPALAGGAILDVGGYPVALAVGLAAAAGVDLAELSVTDATGTIGDTGVDEQASATITAAGISADVACAITAELPRSGSVTGVNATLELTDSFGSREASAAGFILHADGRDIDVELPTVDPFAAEADAVSLALAEGRTEIPEVPWSHSRAVARLLAEWRVGLDG